MIIHLKDLLTQTIETLDYRIKRRDSGDTSPLGIPTGFQKLDTLLDGLQPEFYIIGGRPSQGKSSLVKDIVINAVKSGYAGHIVNIEDGNANTTLRIIAKESGIDLWKLKKGIISKIEYGNLLRLFGDLSELNLTFDDVSNKIDTVVNSIHKAVKDYGAKFAVVDYLQLIQPDNNFGKKELETIGEISGRLKAITKELKIPVIAVAQLNRGCEAREDKRPLLSDLRSCGQIEQDADVAMFIYRDSYYTRNYDDKSAELLIRKGRNCGTGKIDLIFDDLKTTFREVL